MVFIYVRLSSVILSILFILPTLICTNVDGSFSESEVDINGISGRLYLPVPESKSEKFPAIIISHGLGIGRFYSFASTGIAIEGSDELIKELLNEGYAVFIYDKRGHGKSSGEFELEQMVQDISDITDYLEDVPGIDPSGIGAIGHSLGAGEIALSVSKDRRMGAVVLISPPKSLFKSGINIFSEIVKDGLPPLLLLFLSRPSLIPVILGSLNYLLPYTYKSPSMIIPVYGQYKMLRLMHQALKFRPIDEVSKIDNLLIVGGYEDVMINRNDIIEIAENSNGILLWFNGGHLDSLKDEKNREYIIRFLNSKLKS